MRTSIHKFNSESHPTSTLSTPLIPKPVTESKKPPIPKPIPESKKPPLPKPSPDLKPPTIRTIGELPPFVEMSSPSFKWGTRDAADFIKDVERAYETTIGWRKNVFKLPSGQSGKHFTQALSRLFSAYGERTPMECIALKAASIITPLLLQQPSGKPTYRDNDNHLTRRLQLWEEGKIIDLLDEGFTIQAQLVASRKALDVFNNNFKGAMSLITEKGKGGILTLNDKTKREMLSKHPKAEPININALLSGELPPTVHPVFYSEMNGDLVKKCLRTKGGAGVSQQDARWSPGSKIHQQRYVTPWLFLLVD